ncbi:hypothetical protein MLD38_020487 [Melastoma candidum]|uniref:Uncharacterized protein n=1 Tax=Melastoma candidum TaxID=119954 RepID=A0ACB9QD69_9MYRT|nr:hypothetical protein MLD38_020487 [Melastoma candidum]
MDDLYFLLLLLLIFLPIILFFIVVRGPPSRLDLKSRHVLITGGSSGIGLSLARLAASEGARVSILARNQSSLSVAAESIRLSTGVEVSAFSADVRDYDAVRNVIEQAGEVDVLIINAGVFVPEELDKQDLEEVRKMIDVNLMGSFNVVKAALPGMKRRENGGRAPRSIAFMSSQAGQVGIYGYTAYSASKFGLRGFAEALQQEVIGDDIYVSLIFPPDTDTPGLAEENKRKPPLTSIIAGSSGSMTADDVARKTLDGIKASRFIITCNSMGRLLSIAAAGMSPQRSIRMALIEVLGIGMTRLVALFVQCGWYKSIHEWHAVNKQ